MRFERANNEYFIDCDGCISGAAGATLDSSTGSLYLTDASGNGIAGKTIAGFADPTGISTTVSATATPLGSPQTFSFDNMTQNQLIKMFEQSGFVVSPADSLLSKITKAHPGINLRKKNPICSLHVNITPGSGEGGSPVTGSFHFDLLSPLEPGSSDVDPILTAAHAGADVLPDLETKPLGLWTLNHLCK